MPEYIETPTGLHKITDLLAKVTRSTVINLRARPAQATSYPAPKALTTTGKRVKYDLQARIRQSRATIEELQAEYQLTERQARLLQWQSRHILRQLGIHD